MLKILTTTGRTAFRADNPPWAFEKGDLASVEQFTAHAEKMNARAEELGIKTRYEVKDVAD